MRQTGNTGKRTRSMKVALAALFLCITLFYAGCIFIDEVAEDPGYDAGTGKMPVSVTVAPVHNSATHTPIPVTAAFTPVPDDTVPATLTSAPADTATPTPTSTPTFTPTPTSTPTPTPTKALLRINEVLPTNSKYSKHNGGYYDAVELYNASDEPVMLSDFCLSDSKKHLTDYPLPAVELAPGGYAVLYCTGEYEVKGEYDLAFKLSYFGEKIYLSDKEGNIIEKLEYPELPQNVSVGRDGDEIRYYEKPSLGKENSGGCMGMAAVPEVDLAPGFYEGEQTVSFTTPGTIRYTLDGSKPNASSKVWDGTPITIKSNCAIRAYAAESGCLDSFDATYSYFIDAPEYELDVVRISLKNSDFDTMNENYLEKSKYAANISMFSNGVLEFSEDCCISVFGGSSRKYSKKSYEVKFSTDYGPSKLKYKVFDDLDIDEFNSLVLRSGGQDNEGALMRDEFTSSVSMSNGIIDNILVQAYKPVNLYVNNKYWGVYYIREHVDEDMVASHYNCDPEEVTIIKQMKNIEAGKDYKEFLDLWKYVKDHKLTNDEAYDYICSVVDVQSVADYYIIELWCGNIDMDNVKVAKAGGKWFFILYDLDLTFSKPAEGTTEREIGTFNAGYYTFNALIYRLLENKDFRELFCERMALIVSNVYNDENVQAYVDGLSALISHDMQYNCERWYGVNNQVKDSHYANYKGWKKAVTSLRNNVTGRGRLIVLDFIKAKSIEQELVDKYFADIIK